MEPCAGRSVPELNGQHRSLKRRHRTQGYKQRLVAARFLPREQRVLIQANAALGDESPHALPQMALARNDMSDEVFNRLAGVEGRGVPLRRAERGQQSTQVVPLAHKELQTLIHVVFLSHAPHS